MKLVLALSVMVVFATIGIGAYIYRHGTAKLANINVKQALGSNLALFVPIMLAALAIVVPDVVHAAGEGVDSSMGLGMIGVALSTGLACVGAGVAVSGIGAAAIGAVSEDPKILGKTLIFLGLGEGVAIYGLIISIMILSKF